MILRLRPRLQLNKAGAAARDCCQAFGNPRDSKAFAPELPLTAIEPMLGYDSQNAKLKLWAEQVMRTNASSRLLLT
jgi:hypothetical protein